MMISGVEAAANRHGCVGREMHDGGDVKFSKFIVF